MYSPLGDLSPKEFLQCYWQRKPLVIRNALVNYPPPLTPDELAGLACEEGVVAKLVIEKGGTHPWQVIHGPLDESIFATLPESHWTLLVNDVEKHIPEVAELIDQFRFIPEWRFDDVMISYAPKHGSVGPHLDQYDVFILQAQGHRRWQIHNRPVEADNQVPDTELRIQKDFRAESEWVLAPGDMIYLPPGVSHYGVAMDDCMSISIGYRAPSHGEMLVQLMEYLCKDLPDSLTYRDVDLLPQEYSCEIAPQAVNHFQRILQHHLQSAPAKMPTWFGRFVSDPQTEYFHEPEHGIEDVDTLMASCVQLTRHPASRFAFQRQQQAATLFIDGEDYPVSRAFACMLCATRTFEVKALVKIATDYEQRLLLDLYNSGKLYTKE